ncbi:hypothetical protein JQ597_28800 [Bradyrhizobium sp. AUGA SZCCT0177]|uniref:hypothetical protein n=1 Tax=Bradyrhizobium sp. AUGA SZCCT0177 TaxID=2807665 RepID=UPI001BABAB79|nr:hypothetical protein [Bradyrhizobium sp. AUGA SZCCT0177]MBR1286057.1 hypothetical protein [Bradyrhizobium sp. AUGA SZCCT0177]
MHAVRNRITLGTIMMEHMIALIPHLTTACSVRHVRVSLPLVACLVDNERYFLPGDLPALAGHDLRPLFRPRLGQGNPSPQPRPRHRPRHHISRRDTDELDHILGPVTAR